MNVWVDPPEGWKYGFPKQMPVDTPDAREWLFTNGYPKKVVEDYGPYFFVRQWKVEEINNGV